MTTEQDTIAALEQDAADMRDSRVRDAYGLTYKNRKMMRVIRDLGNNGKRRLTRPMLAEAALGDDNLSEGSRPITVTARIKLLRERGVIEESNYLCKCCNQEVRSFKLTALGEQALEASREEE